MGVPILDFEARDLLSAKDTDWAYRFVKAYYSLSGMKCMIYMSSYYTRTLDWSRLAEEGYPLWVANYGQERSAERLSGKYVYRQGRYGRLLRNTGCTSIRREAVWKATTAISISTSFSVPPKTGNRYAR